MNKKGGYVIIDVSSANDNLYEDLTKATALNKPVLIYGDDEPYFADEVTFDSVGKTFDIVKGNQTINVASDGTITKTGEKQSKLYFHPIIIYNGNEYNLSIIIINNSSTAFTKDSLLTYIKGDINARYLISGCYYDASYYLSPTYLRVNNDVVYLIGIDSAGTQHSEFNNTISFDDLVNDASTFADGVNQIL